MLKTNKILKRLMCITLACVLIVVGITGASGFKQANAMTAHSANDEGISLEGLVAVVLYENEDDALIAYVLDENEEEYTYRLENEEGYRESQIAMARCSSLPQTRCQAPNGSRLSSTIRMDIDDIKEFIESKQAAAQEYLDDMGTSEGIMMTTFAALVGTLFPAGGLIFTIVNAISTLAANEVASRPDQWWQTALYEIITGEITAVCRCIYINVATEYPKAWMFTSKIY